MAAVERTRQAENFTHSQISPTYISSDLLSPTQRDRITIPSIGQQPVRQQPLGGTTWGEDLTNYGGIGKLDFLGKRRARDLYVSRSHRHFISGFSTYESAVQPSQVTSLLNSECRLNDQVLPPTFQCSLDPQKYKSWISRTSNPYFSHTCKCEVLPRHDPDRKDEQGMYKLSPVTMQALKDYYHQVYEEPRYAKAFPDNTEQIRNNLDSIRGEEFPYNRQHYLKQSKPQKNNEEKKEDKKEDKENKKEEECCSCISGTCFQQVVLGMGSAAKHCCLQHILARVLEYLGMEALSDTLTHLFQALESPTCVAKLKVLLGSNANHILAEIEMLHENMTSTSNEGIEAASMQWKCALEADEDGIKRPQGKFFMLLSQDGKTSRPSTPEGNNQETDGKSEHEKGEDVKSETEMCEVGKSEAENNEGHKIEVDSRVFDHRKPANITVGRFGSSQHGVPSQYSSPWPPAPVWPPGTCYNINKPWLSIQCIESFPYNPVEGFKKKKPYKLQKLDCPKKPLKPGPNMSLPEQRLKPLPLLQPGSPPRRVTFAPEIPRTQSPTQPESTEMSDMTARHLRYKDYMNAILPVKLRNNKVADTQELYTDTFPASITTMKDRSDTHLPPLHAMLKPTGNRIQDHLGLRFKTEAHKRFHQLYQEPVPDLRTTNLPVQVCSLGDYSFKKFGKKYFFHDYHASVFRG